ncbi:hypothetical protein WR25_04589 [Diploscapter pachys]|uniref:Uncharacterized protein n=1 Tax=Diploscapter pachys TaxID=2018661 RepID=A0A2A2LKQ5_9BILA|nr:hypothetical protein WR25_04589 [Diploscapter pachys]
MLAEKKLIKNLHFPVDEAKKYSEVVCNFLSGLHVYRGRDEYNPNDSLEKEYYGVNKEVSEFGTASASSIRRMVRDAWRAHEENQPSVFDADYFDVNFFDQFLPLYIKYTST